MQICVYEYVCCVCCIQFCTILILLIVAELCVVILAAICNTQVSCLSVCLCLSSVVCLSVCTLSLSLSLFFQA